MNIIMGFIIDKQTYDDLKIFGKGRGNSIYSVFNTTRTHGGALVLEEMFNLPMSDAEKINERSSVIRFFYENDIHYNFNNEWFDTVEYYLSNKDNRTRISAMREDVLQRKIKNYVGANVEYEQLYNGIIAVIEIINSVRDFLSTLNIDKSTAYEPEYNAMKLLIDDASLVWCQNEKGTKKISYQKSSEYDDILRYEANDKVKKILYYLYNIDAYSAIADVARKQGFAFGEALPQNENKILRIEGLHHPLLKNAVPNNVFLAPDKNILFLTGANMAGKSTFMKSFGIAIFLAHIGFPVPATSMKFTVQNGMYTTINLSDSLNMGYSHFYAEVLRLKKIVDQVVRTENLVVIFDELFRGTNVKDAYEATVEITKAFAQKEKCTFMISTHIIEAGEDLKDQCKKITFVYLPTIMNGSNATYTYKLESGITGDRHGMMIINNEHIIEILKSRQL